MVMKGNVGWWWGREAGRGGTGRCGRTEMILGDNDDEEWSWRMMLDVDDDDDDEWSWRMLLDDGEDEDDDDGDGDDVEG